MMVNGFIMVSITMNMSRRQPLFKKPLEANNVAILRWQPMDRSHSHLPPPHPCISFADIPSETNNIGFSRGRPLSHPFNILSPDLSQSLIWFGLNDDIENPQSKLNTALLSILILAPFQCKTQLCTDIHLCTYKCKCNSLSS